MMPAAIKTRDQLSCCYLLHVSVPGDHDGEQEGASAASSGLLQCPKSWYLAGLFRIQKQASSSSCHHAASYFSFLFCAIWSHFSSVPSLPWRRILMLWPELVSRVTSWLFFAHVVMSGQIRGRSESSLPFVGIIQQSSSFVSMSRV